MIPIQIWLPTISSTIGRPELSRDRQRAYQAWRGELTVWLSPDAEQEVRWMEDPFRRFLLLPSETVDRIDVFHVGPGGCVSGRGALARFPGGRLDGLLDAWLNAKQIPLTIPPNELTLSDFPRLIDGKIVYGNLRAQLGPRNMFPIDSYDPVSRKFSTSWPPPDSRLVSISPDQEAAELCGPLDVVDRTSIPIAANAEGEASIWIRIAWPSPLGELIPHGDGMDILYGQSKMRRILQRAVQDPVGALREARGESAPYVTKGTSTRLLAWYYPLLALGEEVLFFHAEGEGFHAPNLTELKSDQRFRSALREEVTVRRAWGPLGLFWALLEDRLEASSLRTCERCGRPVSGKRGKRFCSDKENPACFRERRASDKRKSRLSR